QHFVSILNRYGSSYEKNKSNKEYILYLSDVAKDIIENNGKISIGAHENYIPGLNTHWEIWLLSLTGLENYEALKAATINGAEKLDLQEEIGSLEKGKLADLIVLKENPIKDISNTLTLEKTIINGE